MSRNRAGRNNEERCDLYTRSVDWLLEAGPFAARDGEGRELFADAVVRLREAAAVVLEGPSGSGKTTLLRHLTGLARARPARRSLLGEPYQEGRLAAWRARVTLLAQDAPVTPGSVRRNLDLPFRLRSAGSVRFDPGRADELLEMVGLGEISLDRDVATLSGGERHRLAIVRGLLWDPPVLVADEPLSGVDPDTAEHCFDQLLAFARRPGHALLVVLHHRRLGGRADRSLRLEGGRLESG